MVLFCNSLKIANIFVARGRYIGSRGLFNFEPLSFDFAKLAGQRPFAWLVKQRFKRYSYSKFQYLGLLFFCFFNNHCYNRYSLSKLWFNTSIACLDIKLKVAMNRLRC